MREITLAPARAFLGNTDGLAAYFWLDGPADACMTRRYQILVPDTEVFWALNSGYHGA